MPRIDLWTAEEREALRLACEAQVAQHVAVDITDISVCGSYCFGGLRQDSDMDVIVWVTTLDPGYSINKLLCFSHNGIMVDVTLRLASRKSELFGGYMLPKYSLVTSAVEDLVEDDLIDWVNRQITTYPGDPDYGRPAYTDGRDWSDFLGNSGLLNLPQ